MESPHLVTKTEYNFVISKVMIWWKEFKINTKVMMLLYRDQAWKISIVLFIFGGISLAITWASLVGCYPPPSPPCTSISQCPPQSLPAGPCPDVIQYFYPTITVVFLVIAIILLMISRHRKNQTEST